MILYPTLDEAIELHSYLIERFGGSQGIRDLGLLESALFRPQTGYYEDIAGQAAALLESLISNHPFIDGNKRVAFFLTDIFLRMNGWKIKVQAKAGHKFLMNILNSPHKRFEKLDKWLRKHMVSYK